jgi:uncharacterized protein (TIGR02246 family)
MVEELRKIVEKAWLDYAHGVHKGDALAMASLFTEDAIMLPPNSEMIRGRKAIQKYTEFQVKVGLKDANFTTVEASRSGDTIYEMGNLNAKVSPKGKKSFEEKLQYVCIWKHTASGWKAHWTIWNSREPPQK